MGLYVCVLFCKGSFGSCLVLTDSVESMQLFQHSHKGELLIASKRKAQGIQFGQRCRDKHYSAGEIVCEYFPPVVILLTCPAQILLVVMTKSYTMMQECQQPLLLMTASGVVKRVCCTTRFISVFPSVSFSLRLRLSSPKALGSSDCSPCLGKRWANRAGLQGLTVYKQL